ALPILVLRCRVCKNGLPFEQYSPVHHLPGKGEVGPLGLYHVLHEVHTYIVGPFVDHPSQQSLPQTTMKLLHFLLEIFIHDRAYKSVMWSKTDTPSSSRSTETKPLFSRPSNAEISVFLDMWMASNTPSTPLRMSVTVTVKGFDCKA